MWVPYGWHIFLIGCHESSCTLFQPFFCDKLFQALDDPVRSSIVDWNVDFVEEYGESNPVVGEVGQDLRRWLSAAR